MRSLSLFLLAAAAVSLSSCAFHRPIPPPGPVKPGALWGWNAEEAAKAKGDSDVSVKVVLSEQMAHLYHRDNEFGWTYVASGIPHYDTPTGSYKIMERTADKKSNLYGKIYDAAGNLVEGDARIGRDAIPAGGKFQGAKMSYWMRITSDGLGMHVGPLPHPGRPASHGCVRLPADAAKAIFEHVRVGTPVTIVQNANDPPPPARTTAPTPKAALKARSRPAAAPPKPAATPAATPPAPGLPALQDTPPTLPVPAVSPDPKPPGT